jgi:hypothetical protein
MYYSRLSDETGEPNSVKYDTRHALKDFDFLHLIDYRNVPVIQYVDKKAFVPEDFETAPLMPNSKILKGDKALFDFASAVVTQLHYRSHVKTVEMLREVNEFFHQSIIEAGYSLYSRPADELRDALKEPVELVIPGAQTRSIWKDRVDAGIRMLRELPFSACSVDVTFTGRCPEGGGRILNEAGDMILYFEEHRESIPKTINVRIHREDKAQNTKENLIHSLARSNPPIQKGCHFFFISSLFHLPRLAQEASSVLKDHSNIARQITLLSPQRYMNAPEEAFGEATYMKSALFEFFQRLLTGRIEKLRDRPGYGAEYG